MGQTSLRETLIGALIGLARTCSNNPPTAQTDGLLIAGLHASDPASPMTDDQLLRMIARVRADKAAVSPNCVHCASPCGKNDEYDLRRLADAPEEVRAAKSALLDGLRAAVRGGHMGQIVYDGLFALAEDWTPDAFAWYIAEAEKLR